MPPADEETSGPDYIVLYEAPPPFTNWSARARVTPAGQVGNENWLARLPDGRLLLVFRDWSGAPHHQLAVVASTTDGRTWSAPTWMKGAPGSVDPHAVEPKLFVLPNGMLVLSSGRAGIYLWTLPASSLQPGKEGDAQWQSFNVLAHHNEHSPFKYPELCVNGTACNSVSTCYTSLSVVGSDTVVLGYDMVAAGWDVPPAGKFDRLFSVRVTVPV